MKLHSLIAIAMLLCYVTVYSQASVNASGSDLSGSGGSVSYSVGQIVYSANDDGSTFETQGVQQPYEISEVIGLDEMSNGEFEAFVYPNPTTDFLTLSISEFPQGEMSYELWDINGKIITTKTHIESEEILDLTSIPSATYFLKIIFKTTCQTFRIVKK